MNQNYNTVDDYSAVDYEISESVLLEIKSLEEQPNENTQSKRQDTLHKEPDNRVRHNPRHQRISLVEISRVNKHLRAEPVGNIEKVKKEQLCAETVLPWDIKFS